MLCRKAHSDYVQDLISDDKNNKKLWSYIKSKNNDNSSISDLYDNNKLVQDPKTKANLFNIQFSSVFSKPGPSNSLNDSSSIPTMDRIKVSRTGVLKLLLNIKENKATGPDGIPGKLLKTS